MSDVKDYAARFIVSQFHAMDIPADYLKERIARMEKDAIYDAVKQLQDSWICIRPETIERRDLMTGNYEYLVRVHVRPVEVARVYVFEDYKNPIIQQRIPKDLYFCDYCGGHTKNDMRGHCCACGGPRKEYRWDK